MPLLRDVIEIQLDNGVTAYVTPLKPFAARAIIKRGEELYPDPDPEPFERPIEDALVPGTVTPADEHPEYKALLREVRTKRSLHLQSAVLACVQIADCTREEVIAQYREQLAALRQFGDIDEDDYVAALRSFMLTTNEYAAIINAASMKLPLNAEEVKDGMRIFRYHVQRATAGASDGAEGASDIPASGGVSS